VQRRESSERERQPGPWHRRCPCRAAEVIPMLMFKRSQLYVAIALAALAEIIIRAAVR